jgi:HEAT repeat protein
MRQEAAPVIPQLIRVLTCDSDWVVRGEAADALAEIGNSPEAARTALVQALGDTDEHVRKRASAAIKKLGISVVPSPSPSGSESLKRE